MTKITHVADEKGNCISHNHELTELKQPFKKRLNKNIIDKLLNETTIGEINDNNK